MVLGKVLLVSTSLTAATLALSAGAIAAADSSTRAPLKKGLVAAQAPQTSQLLAETAPAAIASEWETLPESPATAASPEPPLAGVEDFAEAGKPSAPSPFSDPIAPDSSNAPDSDDPMAQVNSISQLSDVQPTDWAFQALQNLVERYRCIAGYPDGTFRGNRAMTRYEFAAGLNACLDAIAQLIGNPNTSNLATRQDLALIERLANEFAAELATLRGRVDALEARTAELEANQFSTTTKLSGIANFVLTDAFGDGSGDNVPVLQQRVRLSLNTSFTGKDLLVTRLTTGNARALNYGDTLNINNSFFNPFGTREGIQSYQWYGEWTNTSLLGLVTLHYWFPVTDKLLSVVQGFGGLHADYAPTLTPFEDYDGGRTSLSVFGQRNPIKRLGGGSGIGLIYGLNDKITLSAGYLAGEASVPSPGSGFFNGDYSTTAQLTWRPSQKFGVAFTYNHAYFGPGNFSFGDNSTFFGIAGYTGTGAMYNALLPYATVANSYGGEMSWRVSPRFTIGGWVGLTKVRAIATGDAEIWNYALTLAFPDLGKQGNLGGIVVGAEPYLTSFEGRDIRSDTPLHVEAFYKYQVSDNISITPGAIWLTAPNQNSDNSDVVIGTLRTTFEF